MIADSTTNLIRCQIHFIDEFRPSSHDCDNVLEIVTTKKVAPAAAAERLELRREKQWCCWNPNH